MDGYKYFYVSIDKQPDVHESETANVRRVWVVEQPDKLLPCQFQSKQFK